MVNHPIAVAYRPFLLRGGYLWHPQGLLESLCFFALYGLYLALVLLPARLRRDGAQQEDVELEDPGASLRGKDGESLEI